MGMGDGPVYWTRNAMKRVIGINDAVDDGAVDTAIVTASRQIDLTCYRDFAVHVLTRYFTPTSALKLIVDDLLSVTTLATDFGGRTYDVTWDTTDYDLEPSENPYLHPPHPFWEIHTTPLGKRTFTPGLRRGVQIVGEWGFYKVLQSLTATVQGGGIDDTSTTLTLSSTAELDIGHTLLVESEQLFVSAIADGTHATVIRGVNGTAVAAHAANTALSIFTYPVVDRACELLAMRLFRRRETPYGVVGTASVGDVRLAMNDPDVMNLLSPLIKRHGG